MSELIYLIRHPKTTATMRKSIQGQLDTSLAPNYEKELDNLALKLHNASVSVIYASDLERTEMPARKLARCLKEKGKNVDLVITEVLRERHWGDLQGKLHGDDQIMLKSLFYMDRIKGGESLQDIEKRIKTVDEEYLPRYEGNAVMVGHLFFMNYLRNFKVRGHILEGGYKKIKNLSAIRLKE